MSKEQRALLLEYENYLKRTGRTSEVPNKPKDGYTDKDIHAFFDEPFADWWEEDDEY